LAIWSAVSRANGLAAGANGAAVADKAREPHVTPAAMMAAADMQARLNNDERTAQAPYGQPPDETPDNPE
jgi:hypothetical protein